MSEMESISVDTLSRPEPSPGITCKNREDFGADSVLGLEGRVDADGSDERHARKRPTSCQSQKSVL